MNPLFNEISESEASSTVGGFFALPPQFGGRPFVGGFANGSANAVTTDSQDGFQFAIVTGITNTTDDSSSASVSSISAIGFDEMLDFSATTSM